MLSTRRLVQLAFLCITIAGVFVIRGNAERWCPFGGVEALYTYATEGSLTCSLAISNFYILAAVILITLLLRRAFCGYMCPVGTLSEWLQRGADKLGLRAIIVPQRLDRGLSLLKYVVLGVILYWTYKTSELVFRGYDPCYALIGRHGEDITVWAYVISGALLLGSLLVLLPFCRWLCPLAAVLNPISRFGLARVTRDEELCVDCGDCARACPMAIAVDQDRQVTAARCLSCISCVDACPAGPQGALSWGPAWGARKRWSQGLLVGILLLCTSSAVLASYVFPLPSFVKTRGQPAAHTAGVELYINGLTCRGKATLLTYFLQRDDVFQLPGYLKLEAWPAPRAARARISFDPSKTDRAAIQRAVTEPYYDAATATWQMSPFTIRDYDPLAE